MPTALFEITQGTGELALLEPGFSTLSAITGQVSIFLTVLTPADGTSSVESTISYELVDGPDSGGVNECYCLIDLTPVASLDESDLSPLIPFLCNLFSISSAVFSLFDIEDRSNTTNLQRLSFFNHLQSFFDNDSNAKQRGTGMLPVLFFTREDAEAISVVPKKGKRLIEAMMRPEQGFAEEAGRRNCTRKILAAQPHRELFQLCKDESLGTHSGTLHCMSQFPRKPMRSLALTGPLLHSLLRCSLSCGLMGPADTTALEDEGLRLLEESALSLFAPTSASSPSQVLRSRALALARHRAGLAAPSARSTRSRKSLQSLLRREIEDWRAGRLQTLHLRLEQELAALSLAGLSCWQSTDPPSAPLELQLGESGAVYSQFLSFKSALEKVVNSFLSMDTAAALGQEEGKDDDDDDDEMQEESLRRFLEAEAGAALAVKNDILFSFTALQTRRLLAIGGAWVGGHETLASQSRERETGLLASCADSERELSSLVTRAVTEKEEAGGRIVALMDSLELSRGEQARLLEHKQTELDRLVAGLDRTTRLNETDKEDLTGELMKVQEKIQEAQDKSLSLRGEREAQTSSLHSSLLEEERKGHRWFRSTLSRQHALLAEELALERQVSQTKSRHLEASFAAESEHLRALERVRSAGQEARQGVREEMFRDREKLSQQHDSSMAALRERSLALDSKLSAADFDSRDGSSRDEKGCVVM